MPAVTVTTLIQRIRDIADMDGDQFVEDDVILRWLNASRPRLDALISRAGWVLDYSVGTAVVPADLVTQVASAGIELEEQAIAVLAVIDVTDSNNFIRLRAVSPLEDPVAVARGAERARKYFVDNSGTGGATFVHLRPIPSSGTYTVVYIPSPPELVESTPGADQSDEVNYPAGWEEWLVLEVARQLLGREESQNVNIEQRKGEIEREVESMASDRVYAQGPKIRNVDSIERDSWMSNNSLGTYDFYWV